MKYFLSLLIATLTFCIGTVKNEKEEMIVNVIEDKMNVSYEILNYHDKMVNYKKIMEYSLLKECILDSELKKSTNVYVSVDYIDSASAISDAYDSDVYEDNEGYIKMTTVVYDYGTCQTGEKIYHTTVSVDYKKNFKMRHQDVVVIRAGDGSVQYFQPDLTCRLTYNLLYPSNVTYNSDVEIDYSSSYGICYKFKLPENGTSMGVGGANPVVNMNFYGDYYFVAKSTTFVQACYIHNEKILGGNLSVSIKNVGISISGSNTQYYGRGLNIYV